MIEISTTFRLAFSNRGLQPWLKTLTLTLIILVITKTSSNKCFAFYLQHLVFFPLKSVNETVGDVQRKELLEPRLPWIYLFLAKASVLFCWNLHMTPTRIASGVWSSLCYKSIRFGWWCLDVIQMDVKVHCGFPGNLYVGLAKCGLLWSYCYRFGFLVAMLGVHNYFLWWILKEKVLLRENGSNLDH